MNQNNKEFLNTTLSSVSSPESIIFCIRIPHSGLDHLHHDHVQLSQSHSPVYLQSD